MNRGEQVCWTITAGVRGQEAAWSMPGVRREADLRGVDIATVGNLSPSVIFRTP